MFLNQFKFNVLKLKKNISLILILTIIVFIVRNVSRINNEFNQYGYNPIKSAFFYLNKDGFSLNDKVEKLYKNQKIENKSFLIIKRN